VAGLENYVIATRLPVEFRDRRQPGVPRNRSFRKPGASAGLARFRPRSGLTSKNCSSRWEYQPRLTAPSPLTGFFLRATRRTRPRREEVHADGFLHGFFAGLFKLSVHREPPDA